MDKKSKSFYEHTADTIEEEENESLISVGPPDHKGVLKVQGEKSKSSWKSKFCILKGSNFYIYGNTKVITILTIILYINTFIYF